MVSIVAKRGWSVKNILVTGADGFVGQALCLFLAKEGFLVRGQIYEPANHPFGGQAAKAGIELVATGDLREFRLWRDLFDGMNVVIHLAAKVHDMSKDQQLKLAEYRAINAGLTEEVARQAVKAGVKKMVFVSTIKVNGECTSEGSAFKETDVPDPQDAYALSKFEAEEILRKIGQETGLETVILRLPLVYGPGVKANFLRLIKLVDKEIPIPLKKLENKRSLLYLGNLIDALRHCISDEKAANQTFLVSDGNDPSTPELITIIAAALSKRARLVAVPLSILNGLSRIAGLAQEMDRLTGSLTVDISKIKSTLGWKPPFSVEYAINETVNWYQNIQRK